MNKLNKIFLVIIIVLVIALITMTVLYLKQREIINEYIGNHDFSINGENLSINENKIPDGYILQTE